MDKRSDRKILLVTNSVVNQKMVMAQLGVLKYDADTVNRGSDLALALREMAYVIALLDGEVTDLAQDPALQPLFAARQTVGLPILIGLTLEMETDTKHRCLLAGLDDCLIKPIHRDALARMLEHWYGAIALHPTPHLPSPQVSSSTVSSSIVSSSIVMNNLPSLNWQQLNNLAEDSPEFALQLLNLFLADAIAQLENLKAAIAQENRTAIRGIAHQLKGASANVGAIALNQLATALEQQVWGDDQSNQLSLSSLEPLIEGLEQALVDIRASLPQDGAL